MRIVFVWLAAITMMFVVTVGWYISQPVVMGVAYALKASISHPSAQSILTLVEYASFWWGPITDMFILLWAFINSQKSEYESYVYD